MSFADDMQRFVKKVEFRSHEVFVNTASAAHSSIQDGSPVTGSPGQPVDTGALKGSWQLRFPSANEAEISTNVEYARSIEDGISYAHGGTPMTLRSAVGGFHSVALTLAGFQALTDDETRKVVGGDA